jgi:hypothetical protein
MKFLRHLIKKHWFLALLILLVLWLLPKLINAYAYLFQSAADLVGKVGAALRIPGQTIQKVTDGLAKVAKTLADAPLLAWLVPIGLWSFAPLAASALALWSFLDLFKPEETITITRISPIEPAPAPATTTGDTPPPVLMHKGQTLDEFFASPQ